jgi:hypothetical protein
MARTGRQQPTDADSGNAHEGGGWIVSIAFWCCLLAAAGLYAAVSLAPRWLAYEHLHTEHDAAQARLIALEQEVEDLARISEALASEPAYAAELARIDFRTALPSAESIPVEPPLQLRRTPRGADVPPGDDRTTTRVAEGRVPRDAGPSWSIRFVEPFATNVRVRRGTLTAAAVLAVFAFGFLHESHADQARAAARGLRIAAVHLIARYRRRAG